MLRKHEKSVRQKYVSGKYNKKPQWTPKLRAYLNKQGPKTEESLRNFKDSVVFSWNSQVPVQTLEKESPEPQNQCAFVSQASVLKYST